MKQFWISIDKQNWNHVDIKFFFTYSLLSINDTPQFRIHSLSSCACTEPPHVSYAYKLTPWRCRSDDTTRMNTCAQASRPYHWLISLVTLKAVKGASEMEHTLLLMKVLKVPFCQVTWILVSNSIRTRNLRLNIVHRSTDPKNGHLWITGPLFRREATETFCVSWPCITAVLLFPATKTTNASSSASRKGCWKSLHSFSGNGGTAAVRMMKTSFRFLGAGEYSTATSL